MKKSGQVCSDTDRVTRSVNDATRDHYFRIGRAICGMGSDCRAAHADSVFDYANSGDVPFSGDDPGGGPRNPMFGTQPIRPRVFNAVCRFGR